MPPRIDIVDAAVNLMSRSEQGEPKEGRLTEGNLGFLPCRSPPPPGGRETLVSFWDVIGAMSSEPRAAVRCWCCAHGPQVSGSRLRRTSSRSRGWYRNTP